jgi:hypothetical protein
MLERLSPSQLASLRESHLAEVAKLQQDQGIWRDVEVLFSQAQKPRAG